MYYIVFKDEGRLVLSSKVFEQYAAAVAHIKTIAPSREPMILSWVSGVKYDEKTGEGRLDEPLCGYCGAVDTVGGWHCPTCGGV